MLGQRKTIEDKNIIKFVINHRIIKLPRKALPLPVLSLQSDSQLFKCRLKSETYVNKKLNASINFQKMLKIIDSTQHSQRATTKSQPKILINTKNYIKKQRAKHQIESNLILSKTMLQQEIEDTIRRHNFKRREEDDDAHIKMLRTKMSRSFIRLSSKDSFKRISSSKSQNHQNNFVNWASFCGSIPGRIKMKEDIPCQQRKMPRKYNSKLSGSRSLEGRLVNNLKGDELKGWGDTSVKLKVYCDEGFGLPQY